MNFFLLMYLNYFRGPRLAAEKAEQEERERLAQEEEDRKNGVVRVEPTCKKCDAKIDRKLTRRVNPTNPLCHECQAKELAERQAQFDQMQADLKMTPFLWFQCFMLLLGLSVFVHRNVFAFF